MRSIFEGMESNQLRGDRLGPFLPFADASAFVVLAAASSYAVPIPAGAEYAIFNFTVPFVVIEADDAGTALAYPTETDDEFNGDLAPSARKLSTGANAPTHLIVATKDANEGVILFYSDN